MWIFLKSSFLSIVATIDRPNDLLVRARHQGDIERVFPKAHVTTTPTADYQYRAFVLRTVVADKIADQVDAIDYTNFKDSVTDADRHHAYLRVWREMFQWQHSAQIELPPVPRKTVPKATRKPLARFLRRRV
jgi:hypothetical protein